MNMHKYQDQVGDWMKETFSEDIINNKSERAMRFLEEALELCQSIGLDKDKADKLVEYVFSRPVGEVGNEIGGVMVTLAALCNTVNWDMMICGELELDRINQPEIKAKIQAKQVTKSIIGITPKDLQ